MRPLLLALAATLVAADAGTRASAQSRPSTLAMSCAQTARLVGSRGAIVMNTGPNTYDRYVSNRNFCEINEVLEPIWAPTADNPQCFIGYRCRDSDLDSLSR
jgi:hypothetical protein